MTDANSEITWIKQIQRGDRAAAGALVQRYYPEIHRYLARQLGDREWAEDLSQEVFIAVLQHIDRFDPLRAGFRTWLYRIATNKVIDHVRTQRRRGPVQDLQDFDVADLSDVGDVVADAALARQALAVLAGLSLRRQEVVRLKLFAERTFAEIGVALGIPESTAKTIYYRTLSALREELSDGG